MLLCILSCCLESISVLSRSSTSIFTYTSFSLHLYIYKSLVSFKIGQYFLTQNKVLKFNFFHLYCFVLIFGGVAFGFVFTQEGKQRFSYYSTGSVTLLLGNVFYHAGFFPTTTSMWRKSKRGQFSSVAQLYPTLCDCMNRQASLSITNSQSLLKLMSIELVDAIQPSHPLSSPSPPALNLSQVRVFSNESALHIRWPKNWSFSFNISPSNEHPGLISFRMDWLDLLAVQGTLKSPLQHNKRLKKAQLPLCAMVSVQVASSL